MIEKAERKPRYAKGADAVSWAVAIAAPFSAVALSLFFVGVGVLPLLLLGVAVGVLCGSAMYYFLRPNLAGVALSLVVFASVALLGLTESRWLGLWSTELVSAVSGAIIGAHFRFLADRRYSRTGNVSRREGRV